MDAEPLGYASVDLLEEIHELQSTMPFVAFADYKSGSNIESRDRKRPVCPV